MTLSYLEIVRVMSGCDLNYARSEVFLYVAVGNDRYLPVYKRKPYISAYYIRISLILRVNCYSSITEHGLGTGSSKLQESYLGYRSVSLDKRILDMPEMSLLLLIINLSIGDGGLTDRTPVYDP